MSSQIPRFSVTMEFADNVVLHIPRFSVRAGFADYIVPQTTQIQYARQCHRRFVLLTTLYPGSMEERITSRYRAIGRTGQSRDEEALPSNVADSDSPLSAVKVQYFVLWSTVKGIFNVELSQWGAVSSITDKFDISHLLGTRVSKNKSGPDAIKKWTPHQYSSQAHYLGPTDCRRDYAHKALPYAGQKQKQKWIITPQFTHFCGFHPPYTNKTKNTSDFIFVGPWLITYLQQKWISFWLAFLVNKNDNNFDDSMTYPSFPYWFIVQY